MEPFRTRIQKLAKLLKSASKPVIFTGAGISTNSGIPDYRSGMNTSSKTGPGIKNFKEDDSFRQRVLDSRKKTQIARPSYSHLAIAELINKGYVEHLISQNIDDLHLKSGIPEDKLTELHGNVFVEQCGECGTSYRRKYRTRKAEDKTHGTGKE